MSRVDLPEKRIHLETRIFPLFEAVGGLRERLPSFEYKGTCFLIRIGKQDVFVTARHLLEDARDKRTELYLTYNTKAGQPQLLRVDSAVVKSVNDDVLFFIPAPGMASSYTGILEPMNWLRVPLKLGQRVIVYGFPGSKKEISDSGLPSITIPRVKVEGVVVGIEVGHPLAKGRNVYCLDVAAPRGLSGAPLIVIHNENVAVAGYVIGEHTKGVDFNGDQVVGGTVQAIATDYTPFTEIESLLIDVSARLRELDIKPRNPQSSAPH